MKNITIIDDNLTDSHLAFTWLNSDRRFSVLNCYYSGIDALRDIEIMKSHICIIDTRMALLNGIETTLLLLNKGYKGKILGVSHGYYQEDMQNMRSIGGHGYCIKEKSQIFSTIEKLENEETCYDLEHFKNWQLLTKSKNLSLKDEDTRKKLLNPHFKKILLFSSKGLPTEEISKLMGLKKHTVEQYRSAMLQQLEFNNIAQATAWAFINHIINHSEALSPVHFKPSI